MGGPLIIKGALMIRAPLMSRGTLMLRGHLIFRVPLTVGRAGLIVRGALMIRGPLMIRGAMIFRRVTADDVTLTDPDSHRSTVVLVGPDGERGPDCPDVLFCRIPHRFCDCEGFGCFRRSFGPRGPSARGSPKTPRGAPSPPPWLRP